MARRKFAKKRSEHGVHERICNGYQRGFSEFLEVPLSVSRVLYQQTVSLRCFVLIRKGSDGGSAFYIFGVREGNRHQTIGL